MVSADYQKQDDRAGTMETTMDVFGMKTNAQDHSNSTSAVASSPSAFPDGIRSDKEAQNWTTKQHSAEKMDDSAKVTKKVADPLVGRKVKYFV